ncbi:MAG: ADP-ribosylglycohydrolase family protein [Sedimentisphaerales bacterium]|nr:ADP-ribosylglycohydrolase family protein [Sedimentisphaerales bacterium]
MTQVIELESRIRDKMTGLLIGMATGDALGLPREGLSRERALRMFGSAPLSHRFLLDHGMVSDDTEHVCMTAQALLASGMNPVRFGQSLSRRLRFWLLGLPAGIGWATLRSIIRLWLCKNWETSGVFSAGNGPAMRSPVLGACLGEDIKKLAQFVSISTRITHTDPRAEEGAMIIALAAHYAISHELDDFDAISFLTSLKESITQTKLLEVLQAVETALHDNCSAHELACRLSLKDGVSGYIVHTVPVCLFCWLQNPGNFRKAVEEVILLGGDTDTTGAITGALAGATVGFSQIPEEWVKGLWEWPRSVKWMKKLAEKLSIAYLTSGQPTDIRPVRLAWYGIPLQNLVFIAAVLAHAFRRLLPPY